MNSVKNNKSDSEENRLVYKVKTKKPNFSPSSTLALETKNRIKLKKEYIIETDINNFACDELNSNSSQHKVPLSNPKLKFKTKKYRKETCFSNFKEESYKVKSCELSVNNSVELFKNQSDINYRKKEHNQLQSRDHLISGNSSIKKSKNEERLKIENSEKRYSNTSNEDIHLKMNVREKYTLELNDKKRKIKTDQLELKSVNEPEKINSEFINTPHFIYNNAVKKNASKKIQLQINICDTKSSEEIQLHDKNRKNSTNKNCDNTRKKSENISFDKDVNSKQSKNAFQLMMESQKKSIGRNSPGRELTNDDLVEDNILLEENKKKVKKQKKFLEKWAEDKGSLKRKIQDEAREDYIHETLKKRAKRLKNMLNASDKNNVSTDSEKYFESPKRQSESKSIDKKKKNPCQTRSVDNLTKKSNKNSENISNCSELNTVINLQKTKSDDELFFNSDSNLNTTGNLIDNDQSNIIKINVHFKRKNKSFVSKECKNCIESEDKHMKMKEVKKQVSEKDQYLSRYNNRENISNERLLMKSKKGNREKLDTTNIIENNVNTEYEEKNINDSSTNKSSEQILVNSKTKTKQILKNNMEENITPQIIKKSSKQPTGRYKNSKQVAIDSDTDVSIAEVSSDESSNIFPKNFKPETVINLNQNNTGVKIQYNGSLNNSNYKLASIFIKKDKDEMKKQQNITKSKEDFLKSGIPEEMKKFIKKYERIDNFHLSIFPAISHILQRPKQINELFETFNVWNLSKVNLHEKIKFKNWDTYVGHNKNDIKLGSFTTCVPIFHNKEFKANHVNFKKPDMKIKNLRSIVQHIKLENAHFPVYKTFRKLFKKNQFNLGIVKSIENKEAQAKVVPVKRTRQENHSKSKNTIIYDNVRIEPEHSGSLETNKNLNTMWTEKYKAQFLDDIIGNSTAVNEMYHWLKSWIDYSKESKGGKMLKKSNSDSSEEFYNSESNSRDSALLPSNALVIVGPCGSGKTSAIYALTNELGINVIEINASSKRTGRLVLSELQEATQSHRVKKNNVDKKKKYTKKAVKTSIQNKHILLNSQQKNKPHRNSLRKDFEKFTNTSENDFGFAIGTEKGDQDNNRFSLILFEDIDVVFEDQDEGFISAISTLISTSKRPVIMTSSDETSTSVIKFSSQTILIQFSSLTSKILNTWLQLVCLIEGFYIDKKILGDLLDWNKGDMRRTLLQLQFWILSGDNLRNVEHIKQLNSSDKLCLFPSKASSVDVDTLYSDDNSNLSWLSNDDFEKSENDFMRENTSNKIENSSKHCNCFKNFFELASNEVNCFCNSLPYPVNLEKLWWKIPSIIKSFKKKYEKPTKEDYSIPPMDSGNMKTCTNLNISSVEKISLLEDFCKNKNDLNEIAMLSDFYDNLVFVDIIYTKNNIECNDNPVPYNWRKCVKDSLSLNEDLSNYSHTKLISFTLVHTLIETHMKKMCAVDTELDVTNLAMAVPPLEDIRWRSQHISTSETLIEAVSPLNMLNRRGISSDYLSTLREICRIEESRCSNNTKRGNRFFHYLKGLNIHCTDKIISTLSTSFSLKN